MNSSRLPGKVLIDLMGKPVIHHVIERVRESRHLDDVIVATTRTPADDPLVRYLETEESAQVFRGSESDVLDRYYRCARERGCELIVRITADDPLKDADVIDQAIGYMLDEPDLDYCSNTLEPTYPEGLDVEVVKFSALSRAHQEARLQSEREHVTPYIWKNESIFNLRNFQHDEDLSGWRWTLDNPADLDFIKAVYGQFAKAGSTFSCWEVISYLKRNPHLVEINSGTIRNEGYIRSLTEDDT